MDVLIDLTSGQGMLSFMDGFSGYNQIKMSSKDVGKTAFRTVVGNFYFTMMSFRLKNARATYQRAMTVVLHDMMGKEVEDYVDDLFVKSVTHEGHWDVLRKVFEQCKMYNLKMNPNKFIWSFVQKVFRFLRASMGNQCGSRENASHHSITYSKDT